MDGRYVWRADLGRVALPVGNLLQDRIAAHPFDQSEAACRCAVVDDVVAENLGENRQGVQFVEREVLPGRQGGTLVNADAESGQPIVDLHFHAGLVESVEQAQVRDEGVLLSVGVAAGPG